MPNPHHAIVFDFDGTLVDSAPDLHTALDRLLKEHGRRRLEFPEARAMIGDGARNLVARAFAATGPAVEGADLDAYLAHFFELYGQDIARLTRPYPGVVETLALLRGRGVRMGICTNKPARMTYLLLRALDIGHFFDSVIGGDELPEKKPDPAHLLAVLARLGVTPAEALMVGDATQDFEAARRAGLPVVLVSYGYSRVPVAELGADWVIDRFEELIPLLDAAHPGDPTTSC